MDTNQYVNVVVEAPLYGGFTYLIDGKQSVQVGDRVLVEFGVRQVIGYIWQVNVSLSQINFDIKKIKPILHIFDNGLCLDKDTIEVIKFTANYYHYPIGLTLFSAIPPLLRKKDFDKQRLLAIYTKLKNKNSNKDNKIKTKKTTDSKQYKTQKIAEVSVDNNATNLWLPLNTEQEAFVGQITTKLNSFYPCILHGVTGSGKTEVYLNLVLQALKQGLQALILVPEINLTPQLVKRFSERFATNDIMVLTSHATENERLGGYQLALDGSIKIIIGTRLAVFTPFKKLGLIIVDEEHDHSFKQNDNLHYNARDIAVYRANYYKIPIVLGSATPTLESLHNYQTGRYHLYKLTQRAVSDATLPDITLIDMQCAKQENGIACDVIREVSARVAKKELSLIFINRRGYAPIIRCFGCGFIVKCKNCSLNMVYHSHSNKAYLKCHHCGLIDSTIITCPACHSKNLQTLGHGTQKIEETITKLFPQAVVARIDYDTMQSKSAWDILYKKILNCEIDILVGTQMLVKGHDFPHLTLVVGLNLDNGLYSYDFRATEVLFAQLMQVAGRAGRAEKKGHVILQTYYPEHKLYHFLIKHDFMGFTQYLLDKRKKLQLPPYTYYVILRASHTKLQKVMDFLNKVYDLMKNLKQQMQEHSLTFYPPIPCVIQKLKNKERGQILLVSDNRSKLHQFLNNLCLYINQLKLAYNVTWYLDIDPIEV